MSMYSFIYAFDLLSLHCVIMTMKLLCMLRVHMFIFSYFIFFLVDDFNEFYFITFHYIMHDCYISIVMNILRF